jgi:hypothetical protein
MLSVPAPSKNCKSCVVAHGAEGLLIVELVALMLTRNHVGGRYPKSDCWRLICRWRFLVVVTSAS